MLDYYILKISNIDTLSCFSTFSYIVANQLYIRIFCVQILLCGPPKLAANKGG